MPRRLRLRLRDLQLARWRLAAREETTFPVAVILQNPDPTASADQQQATVAAIAAWAQAQSLATIDVYAGFPQNQAERDALVELDGSPNEQGSQLFARIVADALPLA